MSLSLNLSSRTKALVLHDALLFISALVATGIFASSHVTYDALVAAVVVAVKVLVRSLVPVPAAAPKA